MPLRFADAGFRLALEACWIDAVGLAGNTATSGGLAWAPDPLSQDGDSDWDALGMLLSLARWRSGYGASIDDKDAKAGSGFSPWTESPSSVELNVGFTFTGGDHSGTEKDGHCWPA